MGYGGIIHQCCLRTSLCFAQFLHNRLRVIFFLSGDLQVGCGRIIHRCSLRTSLCLAPFLHNRPRVMMFLSGLPGGGGKQRNYKAGRCVPPISSMVLPRPRARFGEKRTQKISLHFKAPEKETSLSYSVVSDQKRLCAKSCHGHAGQEDGVTPWADRIFSTAQTVFELKRAIHVRRVDSIRRSVPSCRKNHCHRK